MFRCLHKKFSLLSSYRMAARRFSLILSKTILLSMAKKIHNIFYNKYNSFITNMAWTLGMG